MRTATVDRTGELLCGKCVIVSLEIILYMIRF